MGWLADTLARSMGTSLGMGPSLFRRTVETRDIAVPMRDGVRLFTDVHQPVGGEDRPVLLMRTPYGRRGAGGLIERATALRGFQVVSQSCRGTFGSQGTFRPFRDDAQDGADTLEWLENQSWFHGRLVLGGLSYYGWAAWALTGAVDPSRISALVIQHAATTVRPVFRPGGVVALSTLANWVYLQSIREGGAVRAWWGAFRRRRRVARVLGDSSPQQVDTALTGAPVPFYTEVLNAPEAGDALWSDSDHSGALTRSAPPTHIMTGWFDFFLDAALADFATLTARGTEPRLTIHVGVHFPDAASMRIEHPEMLAWLRAATDPAAPPPRATAVRLQLLGSKTWHDLAVWPPPATPRALFLTADGALVTTPPHNLRHARFSYTTTDPTPSVGGQVMYDAGQLDNRAIERRPDVLTFTSEELDDPLTVVGVAHLSIPISTTAATTHLFVRLTDVAPDGRSLTLTDAVTSTTDEDAGSTTQMEIDFSATGFTIVAGHRLRLQVSSGAYPRYEAPATAGTTTLELGPDSPAQLTLPVVAFTAGVVAVNSSAQARDFDPEPGPVTPASPPAEPAGSPGMLGSAPDHRYLLDNAQAEAGERFVALGELFDPVTRGHFDRLGVGPGWRCWEVGAGGRSIPEALAAAVGPTGYVLATDINPAWLDLDGSYEVRRHDVAADRPPDPGTFDLVHARLVLVHVPDRTRALATMVAALRPGGWLLVEDADTELQPLVCLDESGPAQRRANRLRRAFRELMTRRGADMRYGRTLPRTLREAGLVDVAAAGSFPVGGSVLAGLEIATMRQVRAELVAARLADDGEIDEHIAAVAAGELDLTLAPLISAWGRRPDRDLGR